MVDHDVEHEAIELGLGQRVRAFELDRVLRREDVERLLELIGAALDRHAVLLHRFEQRRLRLGRRPVDLVRQDDVGEDRSGREHHLPAAGRAVLLDDVRAGDVGRHQVGRELDAGELQLQHAREGVDQQRLREARHADDEAVAADEQRQQHLLHGVGLADDQLLQLRDDLIPALLHPVGQRHIIRRLDIDDLLRHTIHLGLAFSVSYQLPATGFQLRASSHSSFPLEAGSWHGRSMRQCINEIVHAELVRLVREVDRHRPLVGELPELAEILIVPCHRDEALLRVVVLEDPVVGFLAVEPEVEVLDLEERIEDRLLPDRARRIAARAAPASSAPRGCTGRSGGSHRR